MVFSEPALTDRITLAWVSVANAAHYRIEQQEDGGDWHVVDRVPAPAAIQHMAWDSPALADGTSYAFRVIAVSAINQAETTLLTSETITMVSAPLPAAGTITYDGAGEATIT